MQIALLALLPVFMGMAMIALSPPMAAALNQWLKSTLGPVGWAISVGVTATVKLVRYLAFHIGNAILDASAVAVGWINTVVKRLEYVMTWALLWPITLTRTVFWLLDVELPRLLKALPNAAHGLYGALSKRLGQLQHLLAPLVRDVLKVAGKVARATATAVLAPWLPALLWLRNHTHVLDGVLPKTLGLPSARDWQNLKKRLRKLEYGVPFLGLGALAVALSKVRLGWVLRCQNLKTYGPRFCGLNPSFFEKLLLDATAIFSVVSVATFARDMRAVEDEAISIMHKLVREFPAPPKPSGK